MNPNDPRGKGMTERLRSWNDKLHAFVELSDRGAEDRAVAEPPARHALEGTTLGVKDVIDCAGIPTRNGSKACHDAPPAERDAPVVAALREAGARLVGKTVTTEFAFTDPTDCRNPHDLNRSPGGSSSGSGAAVAAGLVDIALGTQTAGSLCRPAAYCGAVAFKPSYGTLSTRGVTPLAPSFDTVGIIARSVDLAHRAFDAMRLSDDETDEGPASRCTMARLLLDQTTDVAGSQMNAFSEAWAALGSIGDRVATPTLRLDAGKVVSDHSLVMNAEAFAAHGHLLAGDRSSLVGPKFLSALRSGSETSPDEIATARESLGKAKAAFWSDLSQIDVMLTLAVPDGAPLLDGTTGFQHWLTPWTVFGGPLVCLPWGLDHLGRPRSVMLAAHPGNDLKLLRVAASLEAAAPHLPPPSLPGA